MPSVALHVRPQSLNTNIDNAVNHLPTILQTPSGLAILEIQGTIHAPFPHTIDNMSATDTSHSAIIETHIGRLEFPLFNTTDDPTDLKWMKCVYLYVGKHQRLTGEVKKLPKPLIVVGKRAGGTSHERMAVEVENGQQSEELEVLEVIKYKILFGGRPEPVGD